jgi:putative flippase GtrA
MHRGTLTRYAVVGTSTLALYLALGDTLRRLDMPLPVLGSVPFAGAVLFNYILQRSWVFRDRRPPLASAPRFAMMVVVGYVINYAALAALSPRLSFAFAQVVAALIVISFNAALSFTWVFVKGRTHE